jgi:ATP-dependent exoDNAse (exonuclease V) alpha subunit
MEQPQRRGAVGGVQAANAETVEALLQSPKLQGQVRGQVIWIDEAGLIGARGLARVAALAEKENCRVVLSGDTAQHRAVERGDALRILERHAGLQGAELKEIWRQKADAHKAIVASLRAGDLEHAFKRLNKLGMLRELAPEDRHEALAADYVAAVTEGKSALVISPTHAEGERVTNRIRECLKQAGKLRGAEREFLQLKNLQWTEAQRGDALNYQAGMVVQFHQNVAGFQRGERLTVKRRGGYGGLVAERKGGSAVAVPLEHARRFQVYESRSLALAPGDRVRITQNGFTMDGRRLNNGDLMQVTGFTKSGDIKLANGWVISKDHGNLTHGYCVTSYGAQSKGVDRVFVAESSESFRAADRQQFYVSASRFKEALTIYTDDKQQLLEAVSKSSERPSAIDLTKFRTVRPMRETRKLRRSRLPQIHWLAHLAERIRNGVGQMHHYTGENQAIGESAELTGRIGQTPDSRPGQTIKLSVQSPSQSRSRGISP